MANDGVINVKRKLVTMNVPYIHRTNDNEWGFWNDYTITGLFDMYPPSDIPTDNRNTSSNIKHTQSKKLDMNFAKADTIPTTGHDKKSTPSVKDLVQSSFDDDSNSYKHSNDDADQFRDSEKSEHRSTIPGQNWKINTNLSASESESEDDRKVPYKMPTSVSDSPHLTPQEHRRRHSTTTARLETSASDQES